MPEPLLDQIRVYAGAGYDLIPLHRWDARDEKNRERGKSPHDSGWLVGVYPLEKMLEWAQAGFNLGVRLRETDLVIDYDPRNAPDGQGVLAMLELELGVDLSSAPAVRTGSGGMHFYFRLPPGLRVRNHLPEYPGVEFKSVGRQVVSAGSIHPNGTAYVWHGGPALANAPEAPASLVDAIKKASPSADNAARAAAGPSEIETTELSQLLAQLDPIEFRDHDDWLRIMMACHSGTGGKGLEEFIRWSTADPIHADAGPAIRERWKSLSEKPGGVTIATLYWHVLDAGGRLPRPPAEDDFPEWVEPESSNGTTSLRKVSLDRDKSGRPRNTMQNALNAVQALGIGAYYDELGETAVIVDSGFVRAKFPGLRPALDDHMLVALKSLVGEMYGLEVSTDKLFDAVRSLALQNRRNLLAEYLTSLAWDRERRMDNWLSRYAGAVDTPYTRAVGRIFLLGAVARALRPGVKYDTMVVLEGPQGVGKSTMLRVLGSPWALEGLPHTAERDVVDAMRGFWLVEMEEMAHLQRSEVNALKAFLSRTSDRARLAYARTSQDFPRRCVFIGTTNDSTYLRDSTGNRRFLPVMVGRVDLAGLSTVRDQLWAEAVEAWHEDASEAALVLPAHLRAAAAEEQDARRILDPWEDTISGILDKIDADRIPTAELYAKATLKTYAEASPADFHRLSRVMARLGWENKKIKYAGRTVQGYARVVARCCDHSADNHEDERCLYPGCDCGLGLDLLG